MENKLFKQLTIIINNISFNNKEFTKFFKNKSIYKNMVYYLNEYSLNIDPHLMEIQFKKEYEKFIMDSVLLHITSFDTDLSLSESNELDDFVLKLYNLDKDVLFKILTSKLSFEYLSNYVFDECYKISLNEQNKISEIIENDALNEVLKEKNKSNEVYDFLNYFNNYNLKNPVYVEDKVFSNKQLQRKIYHHKEKQIKFYFDKITKNLEFFIVENYDLSDLDYNIQDEVDIHSVIEEFQKAL